MPAPTKPGEPQRSTRLRISWTALALAAILLISLGLRLAWLDRLPWGLHADEVAPSLTALEALQGRLAFALPDYDIWLHAASFWVLGVSPVAVRLLPALVGSFFPLSVFLAFSPWFERRAALLAAAFAACAIWPLALSRSGFSISYLPVIMGLLLWQIGLGWNTQRARHWVAAGLLMAAAQYVYVPARLLPLVLVLAALGTLTTRIRQRLLAALPILPIFLLAVVPLYFHTQQLGAETQRYDTVFFLAGTDNARNPVAAVARQLWSVIAMFFFQGDINYRHNVPSQPVFNPAMAILAVFALAVALKHWRRPQYLFIGLWIGVMLLPTFLAVESPHFLRASGILPVVFVLPAIGLEQLWQWADARGWTRLGPVLAAAALLFSLGHTSYAYFFGPYARGPELYDSFSGNAADLAVSINQFTGAGWPGVGWRITQGPPRPGRQVLIDRQYWDDAERRRVLQLLVPLEPETTPSFGFFQTLLNHSVTAPADEDMRLIVWPGQEQPAVSLLPHNRLIRVEDSPRLPHGTLVQPLYRTYTATQPEALPARPLACFQEGIELLAADLGPGPTGVAVNLTWGARAKPSYDYTVFTHVLSEGEVVGQVDGYPALGRYLTSWWRPGDVIADERTVPLAVGTTLKQAFVRVGLYRLDTQVNLVADDCAGHALGDFVLLPITSGR